MNDGNAWASGGLIMFVALALFVILMVLSVWQPVAEGVHQLAAVLGS